MTQKTATEKLDFQDFVEAINQPTSTSFYPAPNRVIAVEVSNRPDVIIHFDEHDKLEHIDVNSLVIDQSIKAEPSWAIRIECSFPEVNHENLVKALHQGLISQKYLFDKLNQACQVEG